MTTLKAKGKALLFSVVSRSHHPFTPPGKYWDMYDPADGELPLVLLPQA